MSSKCKKTLTFGISSAILATAFLVCYYLGIIKTLDSYLALTYASYFIALAFTFAGSYQNEIGNRISKKLCYLAGFVLIVISTAMLVYGFTQGYITFFN